MNDGSLGDVHRLEIASGRTSPSACQRHELAKKGKMYKLFFLAKASFFTDASTLVMSTRVNWEEQVKIIVVLAT